MFLEDKKPEINLPGLNKLYISITSHPIIDEINNRNNNIKTFCCKKVSIITWEGKKKINLTGSLYYKKPNFFRMEIFWKSNKETDIGSNQEIFWYWAKREKNPALFWAKHEDFPRSRLKTPFDPNFIKSSLGVDEIKYEKIYENESIIAINPQLNGIGQTIFLETIINNKNINGLKITRNNQLLAASEIKNRYPLEILYNWVEENRIVLIKFEDVLINTQINDSVFILPNYKPKINMLDSLFS